MYRRTFLAASAAAAGIGLIGGSQPARSAEPVSAGGGAPGDRQLIELRAYHFASPAKLEAFEQFMSKTAIPATNRAGVKPVGAFKLLAKDNPELKLTADGTDLYVMLPHQSIESMLGLDAKLAADREFLDAARDVLMPPKSDPAYTRYETWLLRAFELFPRVDVPTTADTRVLQLRRYESHSKERHLKKIAMFNAGGEIEIFKRCGMNPVFFGGALAGPNLPNLTYMLGFENMDAQKTAWEKFRKDEQWKKLKDDPEYKDTVSQITNLILRPIAGSQI